MQNSPPVRRILTRRHTNGVRLLLHEGFHTPTPKRLHVHAYIHMYSDVYTECCRNKHIWNRCLLSDNIHHVFKHTLTRTYIHENIHVYVVPIQEQHKIGVRFLQFIFECFVLVFGLLLLPACNWFWAKFSIFSKFVCFQRKKWIKIGQEKNE